ncbi:MAG: hypothetical protein CM15mP77_1830 [Synechococcus sp.]|nr:MAG: hypothetical protein CM15mP77_1830 [Synechococcus sp.]
MDAQCSNSSAMWPGTPVSIRPCRRCCARFHRQTSVAGLSTALDDAPMAGLLSVKAGVGGGAAADGSQHVATSDRSPQSAIQPLLRSGPGPLASPGATHAIPDSGSPLRCPNPVGAESGCGPAENRSGRLRSPWHHGDTAPALQRDALMGSHRAATALPGPSDSGLWWWVCRWMPRQPTAQAEHCRRYGRRLPRPCSCPWPG